MVMVWSKTIVILSLKSEKSIVLHQSVNVQYLVFILPFCCSNHIHGIYANSVDLDKRVQGSPLRSGSRHFAIDTYSTIY